VTIQSYYHRTQDAPQWDVYQPDRNDGNNGNNGYAGSGYGRNSGIVNVADGTRIAATLNSRLNMRTSRSGEPFTMTVREPAELQGARIDGVISRISSGNNSGNDLRLDFRTIELRGRSSDFDATLNTIRLADGTLLRLDADGDASGNTRDPRVQNGAIGAAVGAVIGAIVGGGKGALAGMVVGGAGGVIMAQGHQQLDLAPGADVTLTTVSSHRKP
jgi:hypothetical protein